MRKVLIAGLGNPGKKYSRTRHNMGFLLLDALSEELGLSFKQSLPFKALLATGEWKECSIHLLKPQTYMNLSGESIGKYMRYYRFDLADLLVIVDDIALPFGQLRLRGQGSSGGHNGLKSVVQHIHTQEYARLRMGISDANATSLTHHVLGTFIESEKKMLTHFLSQGKNALNSWLTKPLTDAMNIINKQKSVENE
jgi:peptidyl-tRNA hydrolase, PTH1 family